VGHGDIEIDPQIVRQLDQLGRLGRRNLHDLYAQAGSPEFGRRLGAGRVNSAHHDRQGAKIADGLPLRQPLGRERQMDFGVGQKGRAGDRARHARRHRALQDH